MQVFIMTFSFLFSLTLFVLSLTFNVLKISLLYCNIIGRNPPLWFINIFLFWESFVDFLLLFLMYYDIFAICSQARVYFPTTHLNKFRTKIIFGLYLKYTAEISSGLGMIGTKCLKNDNSFSSFSFSFILVKTPSRYH